MFVRTDDVLELVKSHPKLPPIEICKLLNENYDSLPYLERRNTLGKVQKCMLKLRNQGYIDHIEHQPGRPSHVSFDGRSQSLRAWAMEYEIAESTVRTRIKRGWSFEKALTTPVKK